MTMIADPCFTPMSRSYYLSQGGVFGKDEYTNAMSSNTYTYGTDQDHIAYCGPYLCTNVTDKNSINYIANESYWNADNVQIKAVNFIYDDGSDVTREYNDFTVNGVGTTIVLDTAQLEIAKDDGNFEKYVHIAPNVTNIFLMVQREPPGLRQRPGRRLRLAQDRGAEGGQPRGAAEPALPPGPGLLHRPRQLHRPEPGRGPQVRLPAQRLRPRRLREP